MIRVSIFFRPLETGFSCSVKYALTYAGLNYYFVEDFIVIKVRKLLDVNLPIRRAPLCDHIN